MFPQYPNLWARFYRPDLHTEIVRSGYLTARIAPNGMGTDVYIWRGKNWCEPFLLDEEEGGMGE